MNKINILLTNDDSYNSSYLHVVKDELKKIGNVYVFAPKEVMSAKSCSCTLTRGLSVIKEKENEYIIDGTPSDCVNLGNYYLKKENYNRKRKKLRRENGYLFRIICTK